MRQWNKKKKTKKHTHMPGVPTLKIDKVKDKINKKLEKESGNDKDKLKLKKEDDKVGEKMKVEEEGEKSEHDKKIEKKKKSQG